MEYSAYFFLLATAFSAAFSLPVARGFAVISLILTVVNLVKQRKWPVFPVVAWLALAFCLVAVAATLISPFKAVGVGKLHKLIWLFILPLAANLITSQKRLVELLGAFAVGTVLISLWVCIGHPLPVIANYIYGNIDDIYAGLVTAGSMTHAQRLMVGIVIAFGFLLARLMQGKTAYFWWGLLLLQSVAFLMMFKRGSMICAVLCVGMYLLLKARLRYFLIMILVVVSVICLPPVRMRFEGLADEMQNGGRLVMWNKVAPALIREHPMGIGWRCLTSEMMQKIAPEVEPDRTHLHSNPIEVLVETGWAGFVIFMMWMLWSLSAGCRAIWLSRNGPVADKMVISALLFALSALMLNGLVEYNFGDAEIVVIYGFLIGAVLATSARLKSAPGAA